MSEQKNLSFQEQKMLKLKIEDVIPEYLDGKMKQSAVLYPLCSTPKRDG